MAMDVSQSQDRPKTRSVKGKAKKDTAGEVIGVNEGPICFQSYEDDETGNDWLECTCGRWVHEDCVDYEILVDAQGREKLCPFCAFCVL